MHGGDIRSAINFLMGIEGWGTWGDSRFGVVR